MQVLLSSMCYRIIWYNYMLFLIDIYIMYKILVFYISEKTNVSNVFESI